MLPTKHMDPEVVPLCNALNRIPGIWTVSSCSGHGTKPVCIWIRFDAILPLHLLTLFTTWAPLLGFTWSLKATYDFALSGLHFILESTECGEEAYRQANVIAEKLDRYLRSEPNGGIHDHTV